MEYLYDVFISHSNKDKQIARLLAVELKYAGFNVWFDEWKIELGDDIYVEIERGIEQSRTMIILMSSAFFNSEWTYFERSTSAFRDPVNKDRTVLPVVIEETKIPDALQRIKHFDFTEQNTGRINGIINILGRRLKKDAKRKLHTKKVDAESAKDRLPLKHGRKGDVFEDMVAFALGNKVCALLFFDIDGFSYINAKYGLSVGESIIQEIETVLAKTAPKSAYVQRWNADEFVCLVPNSPDREALDAAAQLVAAINNHAWEQLATGLFLTISCGVSIYRRRSSLSEVEWVESAILGARSVKVKGGGRAQFGSKIKSSPKEIARKKRAPLEYLDRYGS